MAMPDQWKVALNDGTAVPTDERCLPGNLLDEEGPRQQLAVVSARTLVEHAVAPMRTLRMRQIYAALTAACFHLPRTLDPTTGDAARHVGLFSDVPAGDARICASRRRCGHKGRAWREDAKKSLRVGRFTSCSWT